VVHLSATGRLAFSSTSKRYAILLECAGAVVGVEGRSATELFGSPDDLKIRSCAALYAQVSPPGSLFDRLLEKYFGGSRDGKTLRLLGRVRGAGRSPVEE
jgi:uncharacterized protein (DUF1810 family)